MVLAQFSALKSLTESVATGLIQAAGGGEFGDLIVPPSSAINSSVTEWHINGKAKNIT